MVATRVSAGGRISNAGSIVMASSADAMMNSLFGSTVATGAAGAALDEGAADVGAGVQAARVSASSTGHTTADRTRRMATDMITPPALEVPPAFRPLTR